MDKLAISIVDKISEPINKQANDTLQLIGTICFIMGISIKYIIKELLIQNPESFLEREGLPEYLQ